MYWGERADGGPLSDLRDIDGAASRLTVQGVRHPPHMQAMVDR